MSLKSVELQVAIPKATDIAKIQHQLYHKPQHDQLDEHTLLQKKQSENAQRSNEVDKTDKASIKDKQEALNQRTPKKNKKKKNNEEEQQPAHPYKGKTLDISL
ncbi:hypothetical protein [Ammoniphilus sp. CFH 90114]|uniref:hypothetical protein n=1 Tax=Ammoniphilus sp. CFH 90114 TaxID=2493665 RepID=UPI00100E9D5F|nr:hypothetical protein [Ammoniphilus sp. CFH 90114]RXT15140.1 hypothetical protein EIZ39_02720 [Ammoniphilus sp. CFH 90114]